MSTDISREIINRDVLGNSASGCKENKTVDKACEHRRTKAVIHGDKEIEPRYVSGKEVFHNLQ